MSDYEREGLYDIVKNEDGDLMFCMRARRGMPENPKLLVDGGNEAILVRDSRRSILFEAMHPASKIPLSKAKRVLFAEIEEEELEREYYAKVINVRKLEK